MHDWLNLLEALDLLVEQLKEEINPQPEFPYAVRELLLRYFRGCADVWVRGELITASHHLGSPLQTRECAQDLLRQIQVDDPEGWNLVCEEGLLDLQTEYVTAYRIAYYLALRPSPGAPIIEIRDTLRTVLACLETAVPADEYPIQHQRACVFRWEGGGGGPGSQQRLQAFLFACGGRVVGQPGPPLTYFRQSICMTVDQLLTAPDQQALHPSLTTLRQAFG